MEKDQLIKELDARRRQKIYDLMENYLAGKNAPFYRGENGYCILQKEHAWTMYLEHNEVPADIKNINGVLRHINEKRPERVSNANDNSKFPLYQFLEKMLSPAKEVFEKSSEYHNLVRHLVLKHDSMRPHEGDCDWEQGLDIYLGVKEGGIENLLASFIQRGVTKDSLNSEYTPEGVSQMITQNRFNYLNNLAEIFEKNPEAPEIIEFVLSLPSNTCFEDEILLPCDKADDFDFFKQKYLGWKKPTPAELRVPNYSTSKKTDDECPF